MPPVAHQEYSAINPVRGRNTAVLTVVDLPHTTGNLFLCSFSAWRILQHEWRNCLTCGNAVSGMVVYIPLFRLG